MKVSELEGALLDYWVMRAEVPNGQLRIGLTPHFSTDWAEADPIIEREKIELTWRHDDGDYWLADIWTRTPDAQRYQFAGSERGDTYLIAAMRAYVASKFGDEVPL